jgi:microcystin-dependent protein
LGYYLGVFMSYLPGAFLVGEVRTYAGSAAPSGWLLCYGQSLSTTTYADLFATIGYTYGGSGASFTVPDLRGRAIHGKDDMGGVAASRVTSGSSGIAGATLGAAGGLETLMAHNHAASGLANSASALSGTIGGADGSHTHAISDPGHVHSPLSPGTSFITNTGGAGILQSGAAYGQVGSTANIGTSISILSTSSTHGHSYSLTAAAQAISGSTSSTGTGTTQGNMPPTIVLNKIIKF